MLTTVMCVDDVDDVAVDDVDDDSVSCLARVPSQRADNTCCAHTLVPSRRRDMHEGSLGTKLTDQERWMEGEDRTRPRERAADGLPRPRNDNRRADSINSSSSGGSGTPLGTSPPPLCCLRLRKAERQRTRTRG
jgi:hypothetical protein